MARYLVKCLDAKYDEEDEMLLLNCFFNQLEQKKIICLHRSDFCFKNPTNPVPHNEMFRTADMFKGKPFYIDVPEDQSAKLSHDDQTKYTKMFSNQIGDHLQDVVSGLADGDKKLQRRIGNVIEKDRGRDKSLDLIIEEEMAIRARLGSIVGRK